MKSAVFAFSILLLFGCLSYKVASPRIVLASSAQRQQAFGAVPPLPASPGTWALDAYGNGSSSPVYVTRSAGGSGVQHVATCVTANFFILPGQGLSESSTVLVLRDGGTTGSVLLSWEFLVPPNKTENINLCGLNVVGSANQAMTLMIGNPSGTAVVINLVGYDAQ